MSEESSVQASQRKRKDPPSVGLSGVKEVCNQWLDWRTDPEESLSDWKIEISVDGKIQGTYHVHRCIISAGSAYFARLFANTALREHQTQTSNIEMEALVANTFPLMLDYLYRLWNNEERQVTTENAVTLHHLGCYFEISGLRKKARTFWERGMTIDHAVTYLEHVNIFHDDLARGAVAEQCVSLIGSIAVDSRLMEVSDAEFWIVVMNKNNGEPNSALSTLVSSFCSKNKETLDLETFLQLTDKSVLPHLSTASAMELFQLEKHFVPTYASAVEVSSLQERVLGALISSSKANLSQTELHCWFNELPPLALSRAMALFTDKMLESKNKLFKGMTMRFVPKEIVVSDAGYIAVNGTYCYRTNESCERPPCFVMAGNWNDRPATFTLYLKSGETYGGSIKYEWYFSILKGTRRGDEGTDFYRAPREGKSSLPPKTGWARCSNGCTSNMRLTFHFGDLPDDLSL